MHEHLQLNAAIFPDGRDFLKRQFSGEYHAPNAHFLRRGRAQAVMQRHLRTGMEPELREKPAAYPDDPQVLHDNAVDADLLKLVKEMDGLFKLALLNKNIKRYVNFSFKAVRMGDKIGQRLNGEIACAQPRVKISKTEIHRIRPGVKSRMEAFYRSGGSEQFGLFRHRAALGGSLVMRPHAQDFYRMLFLQHLIHDTIMNINPSG